MQKSLRLIVFFIPPIKIVNGGILSIFSICKTSRQFKNIHKSEVVLSTYPGTKSYENNDLFDNDEIIYSFDEVVKKGTPQSLLLHVPEYASGEVFAGLNKYSKYLQAIPNLKVNIMNQNILMLQKPADFANWFSLTPNVTQTTAHNKYASQGLADQYFTPIHHLSTFVDHSQYQWVPFEEKEKLILLSPDYTEKKEAIIEKVKKSFPDYRIITIRNMRYEKYKELISKAKFTITFGEGFDGYYVEGFFTSGITFAVYNDDFFPDKDFSKFKNTYSSYQGMLNNIVKDMKIMETDKNIYEDTVKKNLGKINKLYSFTTYTKNLENFYRGKFTYNPSEKSVKQLIANIFEERDRLISEKDNAIRERDRAIEEQGAAIRIRDRSIEEQGAAIAERDRAISNIINSRSWKITKPLRKFSSIFNKN